MASAEEQISKRNTTELEHVMINVDNQGQNSLTEIVKIENYSSKQRLLKTIAWVLRFISNLRARCNNKEANKNQYLTYAEIESSEVMLLKNIQQKNFDIEIEYISNRKTMSSKVPALVNQLGLFVDNKGLIRCTSRLKRAKLSDEIKQPILIPSKSYYAELLIREAHEKVYHNGIRETLNHVRQKYWLLRGREKVKKLVRRSYIVGVRRSQKIEGVPFGFKDMPDLHEERVDEAPPFTNTGVDYAGPLMVKGNKSKDNSQYKCYICLFTCLSTRAVHLELVESLDIQALRPCSDVELSMRRT